MNKSYNRVSFKHNVKDVKGRLTSQHDAISQMLDIFKDINYKVVAFKLTSFSSLDAESYFIVDIENNSSAPILYEKLHELFYNISSITPLNNPDDIGKW